MSTERPSFGLNSILPTSYRTKAEAFAKCLQDKLRSLGGAETADVQNGDSIIPEPPDNSLSKFSEQEIAENVFLQGSLAYKRKSLPEHSEKPYTNGRSGRYLGSVVDKRGMSSDSEDSDEEKVPTHPRLAQLQTTDDSKLKRLTSVNSNDSTSSFCSCEEAEDDEEIIDTFASQIKGSPTIHNPRLKNFKRKSREEKATKEQQKEQPPPPPPLNQEDLFFDFDVECFSPVNLEDPEIFNGFEQCQLVLDAWDDSVDRIHVSEDAGQAAELQVTPTEDGTITPPPSPLKEFEPIKVEDSVEQVDVTNDTGQATQVQVIPPPSPIKEFKGDICDEIAQLTVKAADCGPANVSKESDELNATKSAATPSLDSEPVIDETSHTINSKQTHDNENETKNTMIADVGIETEQNIQCEPIEKADREVSEKEEQLIREKENSLELIQVMEMAGTEETEHPLRLETEQYKQLEQEETPIFQIQIDEAPNEPSATNKPDDDTEIDPSYLPSPRMKLRRCSSLKTWKTPPGTPGRKKIVRFADALGLDLADVRTFLDEIPKIPNSAYDDLHYELPMAPLPVAPTERTLIPMFQQPGMQVDFLQRVRQNNVSLESAVLTDMALLGISGIIRVRNLSFHKTVHIRYSKDSWASFSDLQATYVPNSSDGFCDNFSFVLYGHTLTIGDRLEFCIRYDCGAGQFWDNNSGANYVFQCMPRSPMSTFPPLGSSPIDSWNSKFY